MAIHRFLTRSRLGRQEQLLLEEAFIRTLRCLGIMDPGDQLCELIAREIIYVYDGKPVDAARVSEKAMRQLGLKALVDSPNPLLGCCDPRA